MSIQDVVLRALPGLHGAGRRLPGAGRRQHRVARGRVRQPGLPGACRQLPGAGRRLPAARPAGTRRVRTVLVGALAPALLVAAGCSASPASSPTPAAPGSTAASASPVPGATSGVGTPAAPTPVELVADGAPATITLGVVVSPGAPEAEGSTWVGPAQGAAVAAYRYRLGGTTVTLVTADDHGTAEGAQAAVEQLAAQSVSGIVLATGGSHVQAALSAAASHSVPVLMPYETSNELVAGGSGAWLTGLTRNRTAIALAKALKDVGSAAPLLIDAGGANPTEVAPAQVLTYTDGQDTAELVAAVTTAASSQAVDAVLVSGPAHAQATVVHALQGTGTTLPIVLTPEALSPAFPAALAEAGGSLSTPLTTVGVADHDPSALTPTEDGAALSAYLAAVRIMSEDPAAVDILDGQPFGDAAAGGADVASHDAVVALVRAAAQAGSTDPAAVGRALATLRLDHGDGLAGGDLDLTGYVALSTDAVVTLVSTNQDPGLRAASKAHPLLYWFTPKG